MLWRKFYPDKVPIESWSLSLNYVIQHFSFKTCLIISFHWCLMLSIFVLRHFSLVYAIHCYLLGFYTENFLDFQCCWTEVLYYGILYWLVANHQTFSFLSSSVFLFHWNTLSGTSLNFQVCDILWSYRSGVYFVITEHTKYTMVLLNILVFCFVSPPPLCYLVEMLLLQILVYRPQVSVLHPPKCYCGYFKFSFFHNYLVLSAISLMFFSGTSVEILWYSQSHVLLVITSWWMT